MIESLNFYIGISLLWAMLGAYALLCIFIKSGRFRAKELFSNFFLFNFLQNSILKKIFPQKTFESISGFILSTWQVTTLLCATYLMLIYQEYFLESPSGYVRLMLLATGSIIVINAIIQFWVNIHPKSAGKILSPLSFIYLSILLPLIALITKLSDTLANAFNPSLNSNKNAKPKLKELFKDAEIQTILDPIDQKLITAFIHFKDRVAKEIMIPRVDLFSISAETSIKDAASLFAKEGYSRCPIYTESLDNIIGVVLYKDLLKCFLGAPNIIDNPLSTIAKPVLYAPENKKAYQLLQEFKTRQIHMAIIVDEYGGTEGIVTIEDILEELVGEIEDEYDIDEENDFLKTSDGGWIIDAKMTLLDIVDEIGIHIPTHPEYETLGGYVYHCAGTIPAKGWSISHDEFYLEVLSSNERGIKKIKILPTSKSTN